MKRTAANLKYHQLIGLRARVLEYPDPFLRGLEGRVIDETLRTLILELDNGRRVRVLKLNAAFEFLLPGGGSAIIRGDEIIGRPWERVKAILR